MQSLLPDSYAKSAAITEGLSQRSHHRFRNPHMITECTTQLADKSRSTLLIALADSFITFMSIQDRNRVVSSLSPHLRDGPDDAHFTACSMPNRIRQIIYVSTTKFVFPLAFALHYSSLSRLIIPPIPAGWWTINMSALTFVTAHTQWQLCTVLSSHPRPRQ